MENNMTQGGISKALLRFAVPLILSSLFQQLYTLVDSVVVGNCVGEAALAAIGGYDVHSDEVQTLVYLCLVGSSLTDVGKSTGIKIANKVTTNMLKKLPGAVLTKINQKVGFRLLTKFGTKGAVNLVKVVPVAGALVGAGIDYGSTKLIADKAYNAFLLGKIE